MEQLIEIYERYIETAETVWEERPIWDGAFGICASTKDHPCHLEFYKNVERWVENFLKNAPARETAEQAIAYVLQTSQAQKGKLSYWPMYAVHGLMRPLVDFISPRCAGEMRQWYDENLPRKDRMPVHKDLYKKLKKREKA